jgi:hypothetical protein
MLPFKRPFESIAELHAERLECLRVTWHRELGVAAALDYCAKHELEVPRWVVRETPGVLCNALSRLGSKKRGRSCNPVARYRQDMIDYERYDAVRDVREKQTELREVVDELRSRTKLPAQMLEEREKMLLWVGHTWLRAYECATMILAHTEAFGGPEAMKASYLEVRRNSRDPKQALRYYILDSSFLNGLGLSTHIDAPRRKKTVPYYEMTL